jgi:hypothetical protein
MSGGVRQGDFLKGPDVLLLISGLSESLVEPERNGSVVFGCDSASLVTFSGQEVCGLK